MTDPKTLLCQNCSENGPTMVLSVQTFPSLLTSRSRQSSNKYLCLTPLDATNSEDSRKCSAPSLSALSTWLWLQVEEPQVRSNLPSKLCVKPLTWFTSLLVSTPFRYLSMQLWTLALVKIQPVLVQVVSYADKPSMSPPCAESTRLFTWFISVLKSPRSAHWRASKRLLLMKS